MFRTVGPHKEIAIKEGGKVHVALVVGVLFVVVMEEFIYGAYDIYIRVGWCSSKIKEKVCVILVDV